MSKLIEQNQPKKSRFLKYSLLASISVGAIIAMPFEGMAMSINPLFLDALNKKLLNGLSQSNENKDTTNTPQQIGTVMTMPSENMASSEPINLDVIERGDNGLLTPLINNKFERAKSFSAADGKKKKPPTRSKTFVGSEKTEQNQNIYSSEPTEQTFQKSKIIITKASPASSDSDSFTTAPSSPNTTPLSAPQSPEHIYQNTPPSTTVSSPSTPYQPTPKSKPNDGVRANTSQKPKAARKISFSEPQQTVQLSKPTVPPRPIASVQLPIKRSSTEVAAKMVNNISRVNETIGIKLAAVESTIKNTQGEKNKKPLQKLHKQLTSSQKTIETLKSEAEEIEKKIKILSDKNNNLADLSKGARLKSDQERMADKIKIGENKDKIKKLEKELTSKNNEADELSQKIDISVNKVVLTKPQEKAPVTEIPKAGLFLNQQQQLDMLTQQQRVNAARQAEVNRKKAEANEVKRNSAEYKDLINEREGVQLEQNQQYIAAEKTKKQQQAENKQRSEREKKRKEENHQKEKARDIVNIREDIVAKMQQILNTDTTLQITLHKLQELKAEAIEDKKKKQEAQKLLSEIKKQEKAIKTAADKAQGILEKAEEETSRTEIQKLQTKMNGYYETVTNGKIAVDIQNLERLVLTPSTTSSAATIYNKAKPIMPLTPGVQGILGKQPEDEDGYLVPIKAQPQTYITMLPTDPKSMDSGLGSRTSDTEFSSNHNSNKAYENLSPIEPENQQQHETVISSSMYNYIHNYMMYSAQESDDRYKSAMDNSLQQLMSLVTQGGEKSFMYAAEQAAKITNSDIQSMVLSQLFKLQDTQQKGNSYGGIPNNDDNLSILSNFEEKSAVLQTTTTDESLRSDKNWKNPAPYSSSSEFDKKQSEYLDLADNISTQNPKQSDILEALDLITPKQKTTAAKSDSLRKSNVSGSIPEIQQPQSEKMHTETLDMQNDLGLDLHSQEGRFDSGFFGSLESQNLSSAYDFDQLSASWDAAYNQRMNTNAKDAPQETLTENSASSEKKQGSIIKRAVSKVGSILQTNDAENRKRKRDGETSKQSTVDQEAGFGQDWGNEYHKEPSLSIDSGLIKKAAHLISFLDAKRTEIQQTTSLLQQKSLNSALQEVENDYQEAIKISQELQQRLIHKPENAKAYNAKAEKKLDDIKNRADKHFNNIETDADVGFNPNWGKGTYYTQIGKELSFELSALKALGYQDNINQTLGTVARADSIKRPILFQNLLKDLEKRKQEAKGVAEQAILDVINNPDDNKAKEQAALVDKLLEKYNTDIKLVKKASEDNKEKNRKNNNVRKPLEHLDLALEAKLAPLREYDALDEDFKKVIASKKDVEAEYHALRNQKHNQNPNTDLDNDPELTELATKHIDLEKEQLQLERKVQPSMEGHTSYLFNDKVYSVPNRPVFSRPQDTEVIYAVLDLPNNGNANLRQLNDTRTTYATFDFSNNGNNYSAKDKPVFSRSSSVSNISSLLSDTESNLSRSSSVSSLNNLSSPNIMKLGELKSKHEKIANDYKAKELELDTLNQDDPKFKELMLEVFEMSKDKIWLEGEIKHLDTESKPKVAESKPVFSRSSSVSSLNSLSSDKDLLWDNTGDIGVGHRYGAEDSCPTPDQSSSKTVNISNKNSSETKLALLRTYQMAVTVKRQELEQLPSTSSGANQNAQQIKKLKEEEVTMHDAINACITDPSKLNDVSLEEINEALKKLSSGIPESVINVLESEAQKDPEDLASNGKSESTLPTEDKESEDKEVTGVSRELSLLPVSSNDCALALSDCREKECLALGDGSKDEEDDEGYNSGFAEEEETIEQLSDSDGSNLETTAIDTAISLEQEAKKEMQTQISENAPTLNQAKVVNSIVNNMIRNRLDASINMSNNMVAVGAGDEEEVRIKRGLWVRGMYGINNHGRVENINGYRGTNKGATIGFDVEIDNNIVGIAYSNVHSVFKFKNSKNNDKEIIDSHVVSIYGQKELPKDFALQALVSASKNFIKDKTTYSYGDNKIRSNVKHRNHSYNAEALLNYNYLVKNNLVITPNIGLRYGKSRDGVYNETGINVQEIALTMKENNILSGIVGTKVKVPLKDALKFNNLGLTFQGAVEHNFKEKTQRINRVVKIFDTEFKQNYAIPKQPKTSYNLGTGIMGSIKNTTISLDYNYYLNKHYRSHQGSVKLKVNL
ncbi:MAG TPA: autotransporter domain-containing protein [Rickettsia endosymbiont of Omalisus fontisbellaquei]|nr:autotransporter domain-containing protein [Rickettsia endosymbiont of Omalisus fontisbellaquei]